MAGQQADSAAFHLASPGPGSSQYLCLDRPNPRGWEGSGRVHSPGDFGVLFHFLKGVAPEFLWNPLLGATPFRNKKKPTLGCYPLQKKSLSHLLHANLFLLLPWVATPRPLPPLVPFPAFLLPPTVLGPLGVNKAQGALPLGRCALSLLLAPPLPWVTTPRPLPPLVPLLAFFFF